MQAMNLNRYRITIYTIIAVINIFTSFQLAKLYGGLGCAISTSVAIFFSTGLIMNIYYYKKVGINIPLFWKNIIHMLPSAFILIIMVEVFKLNITLEYNWKYFIIKTLIYSIVYFILMFIIGMNSYEKNIIKKFFIKR